jgi:hypothetical protein
MAAHDHHRKDRSSFVEPALNLESSDIGHPDVDQNAIRVEFGKRVEKRGPSFEGPKVRIA